MGRCNFCKAEEAMPYRCKYCGGIFCATHRLPENHNCTGIKQGKLTPSKVTGNTYEEAAIPHDHENIEQTPKSNIPFIILVVILSIAGLALSWNYSYTEGYSTGFSNGFLTGEVDGERIGNVLGYSEGFVRGNETGLVDGYEFGFENGKYIGKETGYQEGYNKGYELGFYEGNHTGYLRSYQQGLLDIENRAFNLRNPTYSEVVNFLRIDRTDENEYLLGSFICEDYSRTVKTNAFYEGIHCYYVSIEFPEPPGHAIIAFNTTDRGFVFFEPQNDMEMDVEIGIRYWRDNGRYKPDYDDTIVNLELIW